MAIRGCFESTILRTHFESDRKRVRFEILTVDGRPGVMIVERVDGPEVFRASARIGRFPDTERQRKQSAKLLQAFEKSMDRLGAMVWFNDEP